MYNFLSLNLNCPLCGHSLMDDENLVDNETSIKMNIDIAGKKGDINLSSIYGSYNYVSNVNIPENETAVFSCPHCRKELNSEKHCNVCNASMISLILNIGGKISFCSRAGCKNHNVEFEDLNTALRKMYQEYGFHSKQLQEEEVAVEEKEKPEKEVDEETEIIGSGTFLHAYCPHCRRSLIESDMLKLKIVNDKKEIGYVMLSPYLNVFSSKSTVFLTEGKPVIDIKCFHCDHTLMTEERDCEVCSSPVAAISISARSKLIDFFICSKKGCRWHGLSEDDINEIKLEDSLEW